jgi:hypothetical protein
MAGKEYGEVIIGGWRVKGPLHKRHLPKSKRPTQRSVAELCRKVASKRQPALL